MSSDQYTPEKKRDKVKKIIKNLQLEEGRRLCVFSREVSKVAGNETGSGEESRAEKKEDDVGFVYVLKSVGYPGMYKIGSTYGLAEEMICRYGMGENTVNPVNSDKSKELVDAEIKALIKSASDMSKYIIKQSKELIEDLTDELIKDKVLKRETIEMRIYRKFPNLIKLDV